MQEAVYEYDEYDEYDDDVYMRYWNKEVLISYDGVVCPFFS